MNYDKKVSTSPSNTIHQLGPGPEQFFGIPDHFSGLPDQFFALPDHFSGLPDQFFALPDHFSGLPEQFLKLSERIYLPAKIKAVKRNLHDFSK
ncbi:hypothetical protein [Lysinibacillus sp. NPDC059133]|uniref:hypothetical protein n=1 Tax=Lysinibacillus sp. NPDC059133 TaxID=3346737 RepID=UPI0036B9E7D1